MEALLGLISTVEAAVGHAQIVKSADIARIDIQNAAECRGGLLVAAQFPKCNAEAVQSGNPAGMTLQRRIECGAGLLPFSLPLMDESQVEMQTGIPRIGRESALKHLPGAFPLLPTFVESAQVVVGRSIMRIEVD